MCMVPALVTGLRSVRRFQTCHAISGFGLGKVAKLLLRPLLRPSILMLVSLRASLVYQLLWFRAYDPQKEHLARARTYLFHF